MTNSKNPQQIRALAICVWIFCGLFSAAAFAAAPGENPNVILITIDTLRADHVGIYGYAAAATPNLDALASTGTRFTHAYTPVPITLPAHASLLTGMFPMATGMHDFSGNKLPGNIPTLARILKEKGYTTAAFIGSAVLDSRFGLNQGFDTYFDYFEKETPDEMLLSKSERRGDQVMDEALSWLKRGPRRPLFLWVHLYDPHDPYTPPEPYASRFRAKPYDGEVAFADAQVGRLMDALKQQGVLASSIIVLAGDHGEGLGEHGEKTHGFFIYNSTLHVPLIMKIPGAAPRVVNDEVSLIDVMPTILQALKIPAPASVQGRSLLAQILGRPSGSASNLYAENYLPLLHFRWSQLRGMQSRGIKFIEAPRPELYDTRSDPDERRNLFAERGAQAQEMRGRLQSLIQRFTPAAGGGRAEKEATDPALLERLRSLGYVAVSAGAFVEADGRSLPDPKDRIQVYEMVSDAMLASEHGRLTEARRKFQDAEQAEAKSFTIAYLSALNDYRMKDFGRAAQHFRSALEINPNAGMAAYHLGLSQLQAGDSKSAMTSLERAWKLDPANFVAAYNLGVLYARDRRNEEAMRLFQDAVKVNPDYAPAYAALGELLLNENRPAEAVRDLERAVAIAPSMHKAYMNLGRAYEALSRKAEAEKAYQRAQTPSSR